MNQRHARCARQRPPKRNCARFARRCVSQRMSHMPFGVVKFRDGAGKPMTDDLFDWKFLHQGGERDAQTGLYQFRNRIYSPTLGRWMQVDPIGYWIKDTEFNYGAYENNSLSNLDPSGLFQLPVAGPAPAAGGLLPAAAAIVTLPAVIAATAALTAALACTKPFERYAREAINNAQYGDKWAHCYVSCKATKYCGLVISQLAGFGFEVLQEAMKQLGYKGTDGFSIGDIQANLVGSYCAGTEANLLGFVGGAIGSIWRESCEDCCAREVVKRCNVEVP
jgi:RHS repeat-associated protein